MAKTFLHVNSHKIRANRKSDVKQPPISIRTHKRVIPVNEVIIIDDNGKTIGTLKYCPNSPLKCGAEVYLEIDSKNVLQLD